MKPPLVIKLNSLWLLIATIALGLSACEKNDGSPIVLNSPPSQSEAAQGVTSKSPVPVETELTSTANQRFWTALSALCGKQFPGQLTIGTEESDREIGYAELFMHVQHCKKNQIEINFVVDQDNSRTWVLSRQDEQIELHHRHVDENGNEDDTSGYGGTASVGGSATRQEFPADEQTASLLPKAATNVWAIEVDPGKIFAYELQRVEEQRMFRVVFDLSKVLTDQT